jgi:hypothetical protein
LGFPSSWSVAADRALPDSLLEDSDFPLAKPVRQERAGFHSCYKNELLDHSVCHNVHRSVAQVRYTLLRFWSKRHNWDRNFCQ